ncbi:MAG: C69 family dipeptidase [Planctomycetota bacterium]|jgi:dipeptidase
MARRTLIPLILVLVLIPSSISIATPHEGCYSIVAGKAATADGSVMLGHNEDNNPAPCTGMVKVPRITHEPGTFVEFGEGGRIPQVEETFAFWWLRMPDKQYSDALLNEFGVAVVSNSCPSSEDEPELVNGGIGGVVLRRLVAERAKTALEGVELVGKMIDRYGYCDSGRSLILCDPNEGWIVHLVKGKHWVAARVPDEEVAMIANTYSIQEIDLSDEENFRGSVDLLTYAQARGWWIPEEGPFNFEKAYANDWSRTTPANTYRQWGGYRWVVKAMPRPEKEHPPFSTRPAKPVTVRDLTRVLRDHYEATHIRPEAGYAMGSPHKGKTSTICATQSNASSVFQLRGDMPVEIGALWWCSFWQPCSSCYVPIYLGAEAVPKPLRFAGHPGTSCGTEAVATLLPGESYTLFESLARWTDQDYGARITKVAACWQTLEEVNFALQEELERYVLKMGKEKPLLVHKVLAYYCYGAAAQATDRARELMRSGDESKKSAALKPALSTIGE